MPEGLERLEALGPARSRIAASMGLGSHIARGMIPGEEIAGPAQAEPEARGSLPHRALVIRVGLHHPETYTL